MILKSSPHQIENVKQETKKCKDTIDIDGISAVVCTYNDPIVFIKKCFSSLLSQAVVKEIIVVDSSDNDFIKNYFFALNDTKIKYIFTYPKGLSDARNKGIEASNNNIVAFTDSDCIVDESWSKNLYKEFDYTDSVAIVGGKIIPIWPSNTFFFKKSNLAMGFYSLLDIGNEIVEVEEIFGGNFAIDKSKIKDISYFSTNLGRIKGTLLGMEEIDLCKRARMNKYSIIYTPFALVWHQIPSSRITFRWIVKRMYYGGINRGLFGGKLVPYKTKKKVINIYDFVFLMVFIIPYLLGIVRGILIKKRL